MYSDRDLRFTWSKFNERVDNLAKGVIAIGVKYGADDNVNIGPIHFSGLALSAIVGVTLNAILPGKLGMKVKSVHGKEKKENLKE